MTNPTVIPKSKSFVYLSFHLWLRKRYSATSQGASTLVIMTTIQQNSKSSTNSFFLHAIFLTADGTAPAIQNLLHSEAEEIRAQCMYPSANFGFHAVITYEIFCFTLVQEIKEAKWHGHRKVWHGMFSPSTIILHPSPSDFHPFRSRKNQYERRRNMIWTQEESRGAPVTAAADGEPFLRCKRGELHPHDEYTLAQHKVSSQLGILFQNLQRMTLLRH
jgi:hypothetical protein